MCIRRLILVILCVFACNKLLAANFIVTSNADAGPGTLRQALSDAAANGTATTDIISFNLPGVGQAAITINVLSQLPDITANVIIDGTTQPGLALGVSNAKIIITTSSPAANFSGLSISPLVTTNDSVQLYGLYIEGFSPNSSSFGDGVIIGASCQLVVGAPGKGNVICGNAYAFFGHCQNAVIQSNFIGVEPDGVTPFANASVLYSAQDYNSLLIGGGNAGDGNVILGGPTAGINLGGGAVNGTKTVTIWDNYFNTDYTGTKSIAIATNSCILVNDPATDLIVNGNVFSASEIGIVGIGKPSFFIVGNFFGTDKTQTFPLGSGTWAIENNDVKSTIGGNTPALQNVFTNYQNPINAYNGSYTDVIQNSFYCNATVQLNDPSGGLNYITITTLTATTVGGDAPAGATVQLYFTKTQCNSCNPNTWFGTVTANANGNWSYTGTVTENVLASSTLNNNTVGFLIDSLSQSEVNITNYNCHHGGSIVFKEKRTGNLQFAWLDSKGNVVSTSANATGLQPGTYTVQETENGGCPSAGGGPFTIIDLTPQVFQQTAYLNCSMPTASFTTYPSLGPGLTVSAYVWKNAQGQVISTTNTAANLTAGVYYLYITDSEGCNSNTVADTVYAPIATPVINDSEATVTNASCGLSNGTVTSITVSNLGNANYGWSTINGQEFEFGQMNLTNVGPGQYYFFVYYDFNCPPLQSKVFTITDVGDVTLNDASVVITPSSCANANGSITGITVTGATAYRWYSGNLTVGTNLNLTNVPAGSYYLVAYNNTCSQQSITYTVPNTPAFANYTSTDSITNTTCNSPNGGISVTFTGTPVPSAYRWADANGNTLATNQNLNNVAAGNYQLYVTDNNGCESLYQTYTVGSTPLLQIVANADTITTDQCMLGYGSITNVSATGGIPPYTYSWVNTQGQVVGMSPNLVNATAGDYVLQVTDTSPCGLVSQTFTIPNQGEVVPEPELENIVVCSPGPAKLAVINPQAGYGYRLYGSPGGTDTLAQNTTGVFTVNVSDETAYYVTQYQGSCESARAVANIFIGTNGLTIPNAFTPNGDGINDFWDIKGMQNYPQALVQIFNRYGQKVFESRGYSQPFDGKMAGSQLPAGVYYYIINLEANCSLLSGSLTLIH